MSNVKRVLAAGGAITVPEVASVTVAERQAQQSMPQFNADAAADFSAAQYDDDEDGDNLSLESLLIEEKPTTSTARSPSSSSSRSPSSSAPAGAAPITLQCSCCAARGLQCLPVCKCEYQWYQRHGEWPLPSQFPQAKFVP